jgi:hypothetical protein
MIAQKTLAHTQFTNKEGMNNNDSKDQSIGDSSPISLSFLQAKLLTLQFAVKSHKENLVKAAKLDQKQKSKIGELQSKTRIKDKKVKELKSLVNFQTQFWMLNRMFDDSNFAEGGTNDLRVELSASEHKLRQLEFKFNSIQRKCAKQIQEIDLLKLENMELKSYPKIELSRNDLSLAKVHDWWNGISMKFKNHYYLDGNLMSLMLGAKDYDVRELLLNPNKDISKSYWFKLFIYCTLRSSPVNQVVIQNFFIKQINHPNSGLSDGNINLDKIRRFASQRVKMYGYGNLWTLLLSNIENLHKAVFEHEYPGVLLEVLNQDPDSVLSFLRSGRLPNQPVLENIPLENISSSLFFLTREFKRMNISKSLENLPIYYTCRPVRKVMNRLGLIEKAEVENGSFDTMQKCSDILSDESNKLDLDFDEADFAMLHLETRQAYKK